MDALDQVFVHILQIGCAKPKVLLLKGLFSQTDAALVPTGVVLDPLKGLWDSDEPALAQASSSVSSSAQDLMKNPALQNLRPFLRPHLQSALRQMFLHMHSLRQE